MKLIEKRIKNDFKLLVPSLFYILANERNITVELKNDFFYELKNKVAKTAYQTTVGK